MKRIMMILLIAIGVSAIAFGQTKMSKDTNNSVEAQVIALEKQGWETWKNQDRGFLQNVLSEDAVIVGDSGVADKTQYFKDSFTDCKVKSYSLDNFKVVMLDKNAALLTYMATQDGVCGGRTIPAKVIASSVYVKRGGKWLNAFYQETPPAQ